MDALGIKFIVVSAAVVLALAALQCLYENAACQSHWERSGLRAEWGVIQGCMVQRADGTWVPAGAIRGIQP